MSPEPKSYVHVSGAPIPVAAVHPKALADPRPAQGLIVIKVSDSYDVSREVREIVDALSEKTQCDIVVHTETANDDDNKPVWLVKTTSRFFLDEWKSRRNNDVVAMPYKVEIIPPYDDVLQHLRNREWESDYLCHIGRNFYPSISWFKAIHVNRIQQWSKIDGIVGWVLRKLGRQKKCRYCGEILTTPYLRLSNRNYNYRVCSDLMACDDRYKERRDYWEAHRAEGVKL